MALLLASPLSYDGGIGPTHTARNVFSSNGGGDERFWDEYRKAGRIWVACAAAAGAGLFILFALIAVLLESYSIAALWIRVFVAAFLGAIAWSLLIAKWRGERLFVALVCTGSLVTLSSLLILQSIQGADGPGVASREIGRAHV